MTKVRRNEPCPCGSGRKFKKCCGALGDVRGDVPHTQADRISAFQKLESFVEESRADEEDQAFDLFWGRHADREDELPPDLLQASNEVREAWFAFDHRMDGGARLVDEVLERADLSPGERSFLSAMRRSSLRLYEVADTVPGTSMTLRDLVEGVVVTVGERSASRTVARHECLAARVIPRGSSGRPEMESGVLHIPRLWRDPVIEAVMRHREEFVREHPREPLDEAFKRLPPLLHDAWLTSIFEPAVPRLANTDGEEMVLTRVSFGVEDREALVRVLDGAGREGITRSGERCWDWTGPSASKTQVSLATLELRGQALVVETNSIARGARARDLVERLAGVTIRHRGTSHEDLQRRVAEAVTDHVLGRSDATKKPAEPPIDPAIEEAVVAEQLARHYRAWIDEPVPALDGRSPRQAAKIRALRPRLEELVRELERMYENALKDGGPAYDPSWMWADLGLDAGCDLAHPPPLAHERVSERVPGSADACRAAAERIRASPSFSDRATTVDEEDLRADLDLQRFVRRGGAPAGGGEPEAATPYLPLLVNLDLHRRKVFWVDAALSYMLEHTDADVAGGELRAPFPSCAFVLTDRHALSMAERLLARRPDDPLRGQILRVATVYVTERASELRVLSIVFAFDALGADLPSLVRYEVPADGESSVRRFLEAVAPPVAGPEIRDASPARALLRIAINAILYATSAGVTPEVRTPPRTRQPRPAHSSQHSSDSVYFLPGKIDIRSVRRLQELERAPEGRALFARFMVRGHWRRAPERWSDRRLRWIEPYWKGPDMAAVIEKSYRLRP